MKRSKRGFSLIEMVVSMAVLGLVSFFLTEMLVRSSRTYTVVDDVTEAQQNLRAVTTLLERELRSTGFLVPTGAAICGWDTGGVAGPDTSPDVLYLSDADAIDPAGVSSPQGVKVDGGYTGTGEDDLELAALVLEDPPNAAYDLDGDGVNDSDFLWSTAPTRNGGVIVVDRNNPERGAACGVITNITGNTVRVDFEVKNAPNSPPSGAAPGGAPLQPPPFADLVAVPAHVYWVNPGGPGQPPQLIRDGMVLASDVEDLQFALFYDNDDDGVIDGGEYPGSAGGAYESKDWDNKKLREVRVTVVARTRGEDPDVLANPNLANSVTQAFENRGVGLVADGFRRRSITLVVQPRNVNRIL